MDRKINILALSFLFPNRVHQNHGIFVLNRLAALSKYVNIKVINPIPWTPFHKYIDRFKEYDSIPEKDIVDGLEVYYPRYLSIPRYMKFIETKSYYHSVKSVVNNLTTTFDFDIVDMHWTFPDLPAGVNISNECNKPSIVTLRGMEALHLGENNHVENEVIKGLKSVDHIVALSDELRQQGSRLSEDPGKGVVIINGVDTDNFNYLCKAHCRNELGIDEGEKIILAVGSLIKRKGFDYIIKALSVLRETQDLHDLKLYIVGSQGPEGDYRKHLFDLVEQKGLKESVHFVGQVQNSKLKLWYNAADVFCLSSHGEGSPNVLSEALACGCPVVTTDVGSARDITQLVSGSGICMNVLSIDNLVNSIASTLNSNIDRESLSKDYSKYDWDWCAQNVLEIYKQCIEK